MEESLGPWYVEYFCWQNFMRSRFLKVSVGLQKEHALSRIIPTAGRRLERHVGKEPD